MYFEEEYNEEGKFDILKWWKEKSVKYRILSKIDADVLAIPITTVASEATFSAGSRVIDYYRASLLPETMQMLICTGDWTSSTFGIKRKNKVSSTISFYCLLFWAFKGFFTCYYY